MSVYARQKQDSECSRSELHDYVTWKSCLWNLHIIEGLLADGLRLLWEAYIHLLPSEEGLPAVQGCKQPAARLRQELEMDNVYEEEPHHFLMTQRTSTYAEFPQLFSTLALSSCSGKATGGSRRQRTTVLSTWTASNKESAISRYRDSGMDNEGTSKTSQPCEEHEEGGTVVGLWAVQWDFPEYCHSTSMDSAPLQPS